MTFIKRHFLLLLLLAAALVRLGYVLTLEDKWYFFDTVHYDSAARSLLENGNFGRSLHFYNDYKHFCLEPTYPLFLAGIYSVFGRDFLAVRLFQILLSLLQIWFAYLIGWMVYRKAAKWIAVFTALYPFFIYLSGLLYVTQIIALLVVMTIYAFLKYRQDPGWKWLLMSGLLLGFSMVTLPVLMPTVFLFMLWMLFLPKLRFGQRAAHSVVLLLLCILAMTPWTIRNYNVFDKVSLGRACLAETKVLNFMHYLFEREKALEDQSFNARRFAVQMSDHQDSTFFVYSLDDVPIMQLKPLDPLSKPEIGYAGVIFFGGDSFSINGFSAFTNEGEVRLSSDTSAVAFQSETIDLSENVALKPSKASWQHKLIFAHPDTFQNIILDYGEKPNPNEIRRVAVLFGLDAADSSANGYMTWMQPWKEPDLWRIKNGVPDHAIDVQKIYLSGASHSLFSLVTDYPIEFIFKHFLPELLNFWSPGVNRITTDSAKPNSLQQWASFISFVPLLLFMPIGLVVLFRKEPWQLYLFLIVMLTLSAGYSVFFAEVRYRLPIENLIIILAMIGLNWTFNKLRYSRNG